MSDKVLSPLVRVLKRVRLCVVRELLQRIRGQNTISFTDNCLNGIVSPDFCGFLSPDFLTADGKAIHGILLNSPGHAYKTSVNGTHKKK